LQFLLRYNRRGRRCLAICPLWREFTIDLLKLLPQTLDVREDLLAPLFNKLPPFHARFTQTAFEIDNPRTRSAGTNNAFLPPCRLELGVRQRCQLVGHTVA